MLGPSFLVPNNTDVSASYNITLLAAHQQIRVVRKDLPLVHSKVRATLWRAALCKVWTIHVVQNFFVHKGTLKYPQLHVLFAIFVLKGF